MRPAASPLATFAKFRLDFGISNNRQAPESERLGRAPGGGNRVLGDFGNEEGDVSIPRRNVLAVAMIGAVSLFCWQATQGAKPKDEMLELYGLFVDAVEKVEANYVRPVSRRELLESALEGMLQNLDQHSSFINTSEWKQFRKQIEGKFGGIGIQVGVDPETGRLRVIAPMVGTPAYEAGVLAGDQIMEIDGTSTEGMSPDKAVDVLTGRPGHGRQAERASRGNRAGRDGGHHIGPSSRCPACSAITGAQRPVGVPDRQGQEDRLRADHRASSRTRPTSCARHSTSSRKREPRA